jgi:hypothetical protein
MRSTRTSCASVVACIPASLNALWMLGKVRHARQSSTCSRRNAPRASISWAVTRRRPTGSPEPDVTGVPHIAVPPPTEGISIAPDLQNRCLLPHHRVVAQHLRDRRSLREKIQFLCRPCRELLAVFDDRLAFPEATDVKTVRRATVRPFRRENTGDTFMAQTNTMSGKSGGCVKTP